MALPLFLQPEDNSIATLAKAAFNALKSRGRLSESQIAFEIGRDLDEDLKEALTRLYLRAAAEPAYGTFNPRTGEYTPPEKRRKDEGSNNPVWRYKLRGPGVVEARQAQMGLT